MTILGLPALSVEIQVVGRVERKFYYYAYDMIAHYLLDMKIIDIHLSDGRMQLYRRGVKVHAV